MINKNEITDILTGARYSVTRDGQLVYTYWHPFVGGTYTIPPAIVDQGYDAVLEFVNAQVNRDIKVRERIRAEQARQLQAACVPVECQYKGGTIKGNVQQAAAGIPSARFTVRLTEPEDFAGERSYYTKTGPADWYDFEKDALSEWAHACACTYLKDLYEAAVMRNEYGHLLELAAKLNSGS